VTQRCVRRAAEATLQAEGVSPRKVEVSIVLTDDAFLRDLNHRYRGKDTPTDVLSFAQEPEVAVPGVTPLLGDVVISLERAAAQAAAGGHTLEQEVCWLTIHGILHLLGYDDATAEGFAEMVGKGAVIWECLYPDTPAPTPAPGRESHGE
jgi:probable rRNA maturation factor